MTFLPGDKVAVRGTVIGYNVGGELEVDFGHAYGSPYGRLWVKSQVVAPIEPWTVRVRRRLARWLNGLARTVGPSEAKLTHKP